MTSSPLLKTPVVRFGGKTRMLPVLLSVLARMAPHTCYVEPFAGGAALLFARRPAEVEIIGDIDRAIYEFFAVMHDPEQARDLQRLLTYTPWCREEMTCCLRTWRTEENRIERVRQWFCIMRQSFTHEIDDASWWASKAENQALRYANAVDALDLAAHRLRRVQIENRSFEHLLRLYDSTNTLFYLDPAYMLEARVDGGYEHEMTNGQHAQLLDLVLSCKGQVILSGYHSTLYDERLAGWPLIEKTRECTIRNSHTSKKSYRTECVWIKAHPYGLFSALGSEQFTGFASEITSQEMGGQQVTEASEQEQVRRAEPERVLVVEEREHTTFQNFKGAWEDVTRRFARA